MLYRIAEPPHWEHAQKTGVFVSPEVEAEGFIYCAEQHQILETARRYYPGRPGLWLLEWGEEALQAAGVRVEREWVKSRQQHFAHVFGPVPLQTVGQVWPFGADAAGRFQLPPDLV